MAAEYASTCMSPDENKNSCTVNSNSYKPVLPTSVCDVYVWGSNSSHQLAEGNQEKILTPKLGSSFTDVQQVSKLGLTGTGFYDLV